MLDLRQIREDPQPATSTAKTARVRAKRRKASGYYAPP